MSDPYLKIHMCSRFLMKIGFTHYPNRGHLYINYSNRIKGFLRIDKKLKRFWFVPADLRIDPYKKLLWYVYRETL